MSPVRPSSGASVLSHLGAVANLGRGRRSLLDQWEVFGDGLHAWFRENRDGFRAQLFEVGVVNLAPAWADVYLTDEAGDVPDCLRGEWHSVLADLVAAWGLEFDGWWREEHDHWGLEFRWESPVSLVLTVRG